DVGDTLCRAFLHGADAVSDLEADIPEKGEQPLDGSLLRAVRCARYEEQDVDVGAEMQLTAAVATDRDERPGDHGCNRVRAPGLPQRHVDERRARVHQCLDRLVGEETGFQLLMRLAQQLTPGGG